MTNFAKHLVTARLACEDSRGLIERVREDRDMTTLRWRNEVAINESRRVLQGARDVESPRIESRSVRTD